MEAMNKGVSSVVLHLALTSESSAELFLFVCLTTGAQALPPDQLNQNPGVTQVFILLESNSTEQPKLRSSIHC